MKIRYKIYILLSCKYKKFINNKIEIKISQLIKDSVDVISIETNQDIRYKKLVINDQQKKQTLSKYVAIIFYVVSVKGLTRTILMITKPFPGIQDYSKLSRFSLIRTILKNHKIFKTQLLSRIVFEYKTHGEYSLLPKFPLAQLLNENYMALNTNFTKLAFEKHAKKRYIFESNFSSVNLFGFASQFIHWNSQFFVIFIIRNHLQNLVDKFLVLNYPPVSKEIERLGHFKIDDHHFSSMTLDDIYEKYGFVVPEEILDVEILHQRFLKIGMNILNLDATSSANQKFVAGNWSYLHPVYRDYNLKVLVMPENSLKNINEAIFLIGRCDENWYHFLLDTLPRLLFFEDIPQNVPLLIREDLPETTKEFIRKITKREVIELAQNTRVKITKLYVCPGRSTVFDTKPPKNSEWVEFSPIVLGRLREKILECLRIDSHSIISSHVMLLRDSSKRKLINSESINKLGLKYNYVMYDLNNDFFRRQIHIFSNSKHMISPGGAVLANILFMAPKTKITVLRGYGQGHLRIWRKLAQVSNLEFSEVIGFPIYWGPSYLRRLHSDFYVPPRKLRRMLSKEI